jgi:aminoglycoside phosphotransferase family enzyme
MFFDNKKKNGGRAILKHWEAKDKSKEIDEKPDFKEAGLSKMADGGEADDEHMQALASHVEEMHDAAKSNDHMRHAKAMKSFIEEHLAHSKKDHK